MLQDPQKFANPTRRRRRRVLLTHICAWRSSTSTSGSRLIQFVAAPREKTVMDDHSTERMRKSASRSVETNASTALRRESRRPSACYLPSRSTHEKPNTNALHQLGSFHSQEVFQAIITRFHQGTTRKPSCVTRKNLRLPTFLGQQIGVQMA